MEQVLSEYPIVKCKYCGKEQRACFSQPIRDEMVEGEMCFTCHHWLGWVRDREKNCKFIIITSTIENGNEHRCQHFICAEDEKSIWRGYNGQRFFIKFNDGRNITTTNLWHQGTIPEHFYHLFEPNAIFVREQSDTTWLVYYEKSIKFWCGNPDGKRPEEEVPESYEKDAQPS